MKPAPNLPPEPPKAVAKVGVRLAAIAGSFILLIIVIGVIYTLSHR
jgi:hypothetical protein